MEVAARTRMQWWHLVRGALCCGSFQHPLRRLSHLLFLLLLYSLTSCSNGITSQTKKESTIPLLGAIPDTPFRCLGHSAGYYADPDTGCQVYHMCDTLERQYSYLCPNYTLFNQKFMVCDHWYMVNCSTSHTFYHLNGHIGEVPEKSEREEEQNAITARPAEGGTSPKKSKASPTRTPPPGSGLLSARLGSNKFAGNHSEGLRKQPVSQQTTLHSRNTTIQESFTKRNASITHPVTPSLINSTPSPRRQFPALLTTRPSTSPSKPVTPLNRISIKPQQAFSPTTPSSTSPARQETTPPARKLSMVARPTFTQPLQQRTTPSRSSFSPTRRQSFIPTTNKPSTVPIIQTTSHSTRKPTPEPSTSPVEVVTPPPTFLTPPKFELKSHNVKDPVTHTKDEIPFLSVIRNATLSRSNTTNISQVHKDPSEREQPKKDLSMMPGSVARRPGNRFSFTSHTEEEPVLTPEELQRIVFQPLLAQPQIKTRRILTSAPSLLPIDPSNSSDTPNFFHMRIEFPSASIPEDSSSRDSLDLKLSNTERVQTPSRILQPPSESSVLQPLSTFLSPPTHPFTPIRRAKQEFPTLLEIPPETDNLRTSPRDTFLPGARRLPFPPSTQGNRDFFIPSAEFSLLVSEVPQNNIEELIPEPKQNPSRHHHHGSHMTMVFPAPIEPSKMEELKLNPECPRCHPQFLKPGQCNPCVVIK